MVCPCAMASRLQTLFSLLSLLLISYYLPHSTTALSRPIDIPALLSDPSRTNIEISTGYELFQALASQGDSISNVTVTLVSDILLDDPVWEIDLTLSEDVVDAIFKVGSNSTLLFRSPYPLSISESDLETNPQAILEAGAKILDFAQRLAALVVEPGGTIAFQGIAIRGIGSAQAFQQQRESSFYYPHNFAIWPTVLCGVDLSLAPEDPRAACNIIHLNTYATYRPAFKEGCGPEIMEQSVFRSATAIQNYTAIGLSDPTTIYVLGVHQLLFPVIQLESRADVYSETLIGTEPVSFVRVVTNNTVRACCSGACYENELNESSGRTSSNHGGGGSGSGVPYWLWIIVGATSAVGVLAAALLIFSTTCCRHRLKVKGDGKDQFGDDDDYPDPEAGTITAQMAAAAVKDDEVMRLMTHAWLNRIAAAHELEFKGILGRGASGTVWKANWKGVVVACKILNTTAPQFSRQSFWPPPPVTTDVASEGQGGEVDGGVSKLSPKANTDEVDSVVQGITAAAAAAGAATTSLTSKAAASALKNTSTTSSTTALDKHTIAALMTVPKEVCISTLLSHPRIITFYKVTPSTIPTSPSFSVNGSDIVSIILMEYCDLGNLHQCIQRKKKLWYGDGKPVMDAVIETLMDVAHGVDYLHNSAGVVHNDIRASNVLLKTVGCNKRRLKALVADFSHADFINQLDGHNLSGRMSSGEVISTDGGGRRVSSDRSSASSLSTIYSVNKRSVVHQELRQPRQQTWAATGQAILHLAPELLAQTSPPTPASDVYSFAMLMWNLLQSDGKKKEYLKSGQSVADMVYQVVEHQQRPPTLVSTNNNDDNDDDNDVDRANKNDGIICGKDINVVAIEMYDKLMRDCWHQVPALRPSSGDIIVALRKILRFIKENSVQNGENEEDV